MAFSLLEEKPPKWHRVGKQALQDTREKVHDLKQLLLTIWYFSAADIRTMVFPVCTFGFLSALAGPRFTSLNEPTTTLLSNLPQTFFWTWLNIVVLSISNQIQPSGIIEDTLNKPWRPIPAGRISVDRARQILLWIVGGLLLVGLKLNVMSETLWCLIGNWAYNDLNGGDQHFLIRQFLNGAAYLAYGSATMKLIAGANTVQPTSDFHTWLCIISLIVGTTIQIQDLKDLEGDRAHNRHTAPVVWGDGPTRISVCVGMTLWSIMCPRFWDLAWYDAIVPLALCAMVVLRLAFCQDARADRKSFLLWSFWLISLFFLPWIKEAQPWGQLRSLGELSVQ